MSVAEQVGRHGRRGTGGGYCSKAIVLEHLDRFRDRLFGHPLARDWEGPFAAVVEPTTYPAVHFISQTKRDLPCRLDRAHLGATCWTSRRRSP